MAAKRPLILTALKNRLIAGVPGVSGRVMLPWDKPLKTEDGPLLQIALGDSTINETEAIGQWLHTIPIKIGATVEGAFDYPAAWDLLENAAAALTLDYSLGGNCRRVLLTGGADSMEVAGDKFLLPHLVATIEYMTPVGAL